MEIEGLHSYGTYSSRQVRWYNTNKPIKKIIVGGKGYEDIKEDWEREQWKRITLACWGSKMWTDTSLIHWNRKELIARRNSKCKDPETGTTLEYLSTRRRAWSIMRNEVWLDKDDQAGWPSARTCWVEIWYIFPIHSLGLKETASKSIKEH